MQVAQRGTSSTTSGYDSVDRFNIAYGGGTITHTQEDLSSGSPYDDGFRKHLRLTTNGGSSASSDFCYIIQYVEAQNVANSGWDYTSSSSNIGVSFWVRTSLAGTYSCVVKSVDGTQRAFVTPVVLSANTWTKFTKVIPGDSGITVNNDTGSGLEFSIRPYSGTNYSDSGVSNNTWYDRSGSTQTPVYSENWQGTNNATFDLTGVQIEVGTVTPFEHRSFGEELGLCRRYYNEYSGGTNAHRLYQYNYNASYKAYLFYFPVKMRATPTVALSGNGSTGTAGILNENYMFRYISGGVDVTTAYYLYDFSFDAEL